jgi:MFS family permease
MRQTRPWLVLVIACAAQYLIPVMVTGVAVILPSVGRDLSASAQQLGMVEQTYVVSTAVSILFWGRLGDIIGWRRIYIGGFLSFSLATGALGFSPNMGFLITVRAVQGLSAASILAGSVALVSVAYPPEVRGTKLGILQAFIYAGLSTGPLIGGFIASTLGWRYLFWLFVPFGLAGAVMCALGLWIRAQGKARSIDWKGVLFYALSIALLASGGSNITRGVFGATGIVLGAGLLWVFIRLQTRTAQPLLNISALKGNRVLSLSCLAAMGNYASTFGLTFFMSLYLQYFLGLTPPQAGLVLLAMPVTQCLASPVVGKLSDRMQPVTLSTLGMLVTFTGLVALALTVDERTPLPLILAELLFVGAGYGIFITPNTVVIMGSVSSEAYGVTSGLVGTMRTLGMVLSMTTITFIISLGMGGQAVTQETMPRFLTCMHVGLAVLAGYSLLGIVSSSGRRRVVRGAHEAGA